MSAKHSTKRYKSPTGKCEFPGCDRKNKCRGLCDGHCQQASAGRPLTPLRPCVRYVPGRKCFVPGCDREGSRGCGGLCSTHRLHQLRGKSFGKLRHKRYEKGETCVFPGCAGIVQSRGLCTAHYRQWWFGKGLRPLYQTKAPDGQSLGEHHHMLKRKFGIGSKEYAEMLEQQDGVCAICKKADSYNRRFSVDHNHATNKIRGLLCGNCNQGIGFFYDDPALLEAAAEYVRRSL